MGRKKQQSRLETGRSKHLLVEESKREQNRNQSAPCRNRSRIDLFDPSEHRFAHRQHPVLAPILQLPYDNIGDLSFLAIQSIDTSSRSLLRQHTGSSVARRLSRARQCQPFPTRAHWSFLLEDGRSLRKAFAVEFPWMLSWPSRSNGRASRLKPARPC